MNSLRLRALSTSDLDTFMPWMAAFYQHFSYAYNPELQRRVVAEFLRHPHLGTLYLLEEANQAVGYVALTFGFTFELRGRYAVVDELYISTAHRSRGIGRQVLQMLQQHARSAGLVALHLQTEPDNPRATRLYESLGFVDDERRNLTWRRGAASPKPGHANSPDVLVTG